VSTLLLPEMVLLPDGGYYMGNDAGRSDERPAHLVTLKRFHAAVRPVTNAEYRVFLSATDREPPPFIDDPRFSLPGQPVAGVNWHDASAYCRWLTAETGVRFRLPTEAEREFAARGGRADHNWPWGNQPPDARPELSEIAQLEQPHAPRPECANGFGLFCMADNVHEWCADWYAAGYYAASPQDSPRGPARGQRRASRGGSWRHQVKFTRVSARSSLNPNFRYNDFGFRVYADAS
jgi:formylglycine-generating enzyme required for sulfatase activity